MPGRNDHRGRALAGPPRPPLSALIFGQNSKIKVSAAIHLARRFCWEAPRQCAARLDARRTRAIFREKHQAVHIAPGVIPVGRVLHTARPPPWSRAGLSAAHLHSHTGRSWIQCLDKPTAHKAFVRRRGGKERSVFVLTI